ncbi:exopolyphosphatase-like protein [Xylaria sp. FL0043]|nr:exopolyphosphatase-like protein [Xylaria sp. FL0043]
MPPRASLKTFLATARAALTTQSPKRSTPLTFVVGNESADLDSLCSALLLAYFQTYAPPKHRSSAGDASTSTLHIPICHLERADLALRPEFTAVLRDGGIKGEDVFTLEDVLPSQQKETKNSTKSKRNEAPVLRPEDTRWLLVDHNAMTGALAKVFGHRVIGCVDHHADEGAVPRDAELRVIEKSGSCASLVLAQCKDVWATLSAGNEKGEGGGDVRKDDDAQIDAQIARLALAPILIDTTNLRDENKTTEYDRQAVALAEAKIAAAEEREDGGGMNGSGVREVDVKRYDRDAFFARLSGLKEDLSEMSFRDVFRKDYKEWSVGSLNLATSSVPRGFRYLVEEKAQGDTSKFIEALREWGGEKDAAGKMDIVVVLTGFQDGDGKFRRELLVWARSEAGVRAAKMFEERCRDTLRLETWGDGALDEGGVGRGEWRRCWAQNAVEYSRKQIAPMLRDALKEVSEGG